MEKKYDVLEFYKIINELINLSNLEITKEKFIDIDIIRDKSLLDKELIIMEEIASGQINFLLEPWPRLIMTI